VSPFVVPAVALWALLLLISGGEIQTGHGAWVASRYSSGAQLERECWCLGVGGGGEFLDEVGVAGDDEQG
jgi:hypothetical protein